MHNVSISLEDLNIYLMSVPSSPFQSRQSMLGQALGYIYIYIYIYTIHIKKKKDKYMYDMLVVQFQF